MKVQFHDQVVGYRSPQFEYNPKHPAYALDPAQPFKMNGEYIKSAHEVSKGEDEDPHLVQAAINATRVVEVLMLHAYIAATGDEQQEEVDPKVALIGNHVIGDWPNQWDLSAVSISECGMKATLPNIDDPTAKFIVEFIPEEVH